LAKRSTTSFTKPFGVWRSRVFSCASASRARARIASRSVDTYFMRVDSLSVARSGSANVIIVAKAASAVSTMTAFWMLNMLCVNSNISAFPAFRVLELEIDHLLHDENADPHPEQAADNDHVACKGGEERAHIVRRSEVDHQHHGRRQRADDCCGGFCFLRHGLNLGAHLLALAKNARKICQRFREIAARLLLD